MSKSPSKFELVIRELREKQEKEQLQLEKEKREYLHKREARIRAFNPEIKPVRRIHRTLGNPQKYRHSGRKQYSRRAVKAKISRKALTSYNVEQEHRITYLRVLAKKAKIEPKVYNSYTKGNYQELKNLILNTIPQRGK